MIRFCGSTFDECEKCSNLLAQKLNWTKKNQGKGDKSERRPALIMGYQKLKSLAKTRFMSKVIMFEDSSKLHYYVMGSRRH
jgi:hypothetical protein